MNLFRSLLASAFVASASAYASAQTSARDEFLRVLDRPRVPLAPTVPRVTAESVYTREVLSFFSERDERVPTLIVRRLGQTGKAPVVIALHGTGGSKESMRR